jgi:hypothetical protein
MKYELNKVKQRLSVMLGMEEDHTTMKYQSNKIRSELNIHPGYCPICEGEVYFIKENEWLRDFYFCMNCKSIPRQRGLVFILKQLLPNYKKLKIHEASAYGATFKKFIKECENYSANHFSPDDMVKLK